MVRHLAFANDTSNVNKQTIKYLVCATDQELESNIKHQINMLGTGTFKTIVSSVRRSLANSQLYTRSYADGNVNVTKVNTNIMHNQHFFTNYSYNWRSIHLGVQLCMSLEMTGKRLIKFLPWKLIVLSWTVKME